MVEMVARCAVCLPRGARGVVGVTVAVTATALLTGVVPSTRVAAARLQQGRFSSDTLGDGPWTFDTTAYRIRVVKMAQLVRPWGIAFLPDGAMLVTERAGRLRIMRNGVLDPTPIASVPAVHLQSGFDGLLDVAIHPQFAQNRLVYLSYSKPNADGSVQTALFRGRLEGMTLADAGDIFVANTPIPKVQTQGVTSRILFGRDGMLYMSVGHPGSDRLQAQNPISHRGKILRLRDDGSPAPNNPFLGKSAYGLRYQPQVYSIGHRNALGLAVNPETGDLWETENGPQGGDELNVILPGRNYGWPFISMGREYDGTPMQRAMDGMEQPLYHWVPSIAPSGITFYTGDKFPKWKRNVFVGGLAGRRIDRLSFSSDWQPLAPEPLLQELRQRMRDVRQGPDGLLYMLTDDDKGAVLRIEPAPAPSDRSGPPASSVKQ